MSSVEQPAGPAVLIVGAGAIGQVVGASLAAGGADVRVLVRPMRAGEAREGFRLWQVRRGRRPAERRFTPSAVLTDPAEAAGVAWDQVVLCVSTPALREPWLAELAGAVGPATVVSVGQSALDHRHLADAFPVEQLVVLVPSVLAWSAPLRHETPEPGIAYWLPPGAKQAVGGDLARARRVQVALREGGLPTRYSATAVADGVRFAARTQPFVAAFDAVGWSPRALRRSPLLKVAVGATGEAERAVVAALDSGELGVSGESAGRSPRPPSRLLARAALWLLPAVTPFDLERYLARHFGKVRAQTLLMLEEWAGLAGGLGMPAEALDELRKITSPQPTGSD